MSKKLTIALALIGAVGLITVAGAQTTGYLYFAGGGINDATAGNPSYNATLDGTATGDNGIFSVLVADVDITAGTVSNWRRAGTLIPEANPAASVTNYSWMFLENAVHVYNGRLYIGPGDWNGDSSRKTADVVCFADINPDGSLGAFTISDVFPGSPAEQAIGATALVDFGGGDAYYYVLGGTGTGTNRVLVSKINGTTGVLGAWSTTTVLPSSDWFNRATVAGSTVIHGSGNLNSGGDRHSHYTSATGGTGVLGSWTDGGVFNPSAGVQWDYVMTTAVAGANTFAVIAGGADGTTLDKVFVSQVTGGTPGAWSEKTALPAARRRVTGTAVDDLIIVPGGGSGSGVSLATDTVFLGRIDSSGTITWSTSPNPMLQKRSFGGATFYRTALSSGVKGWQLFE